MDNLINARERAVSGWVGSGPVVVIAPHQDDESLGCGGMIALAARLGIEVHVVFTTDGSQSHPGSAKYPHDVLVSLREKEAVDALLILGVPQTNIHFLRMPDGALPSSAEEDFDSAVVQVAGMLDRLQPKTIFLPWRRDPHRDHRATWQITIAALKQAATPLLIFEYFIWLWERAAAEDHPLAQEGTLCYVDIAGTVQLKQKAIMAHVSQTTGLIDDDEHGFTLSAEMLGHFKDPKEYFIETTPDLMNEKTHTLSENYFDEVYRDREDPWNLAKSEYERAKYSATVNALTKERYGSAFEIGCSIGVLTEALLQKCDKILGIDIADAPVAQARKRLADYPQATIEKMTVPDTFPDENFDLVVMSEVGYFFSFTDLEILTQKIKTHLNESGQLLLVHWTHFVPDFPLTGDQVHEFFMDKSGSGKPFKHLCHQRTDDYRLDLFEI